MVQKIDRTLVQITAENLTALVAADFSGGRNFLEIDGLAVVAVNIRHHITLYETDSRGPVQYTTGTEHCS